MRQGFWSVCTGLGLGLLGAAAAEAQDGWLWSPAPVTVVARPVYAAPVPVVSGPVYAAPVFYPAPVVVRPPVLVAPTYVAPAPVVTQRVAFKPYAGVLTVRESSPWGVSRARIRVR